MLLGIPKPGHNLIGDSTVAPALAAGDQLAQRHSHSTLGQLANNGANPRQHVERQPGD